MAHPGYQELRADNLPDLSDEVQISETDKFTYFGSGGYGEIRRGYLLDCNNQRQMVAIKVLRIGRLDVSNYERRRARETRVWQGLRHRNILPLLGRYTNNNFARCGGLVSPFRELGDVDTYLAQPSNRGANRLAIIQGIAAGLHYLHTNGVIHGDLKPRNVLMNFDQRSGELYPEICDFGISRVLGRDTDISHTFVQIYRYMAPEILLDENAFGTSGLSFEGDVYSMGMVILQILSGQIPFFDIRNDSLVPVFLKTENKRPAIIQYNLNALPLLRECWPLMESCWDQVPSNRCQAFQIGAYLGRLTWPTMRRPVTNN